jgi:hypothetical protein
MTLTASGKLGLATTTPQSNFVVGVTADTQGCEIDNATSGVPRIFAFNRNGGVSLPLALQSVGGNLLVGTTTDSGFKLDVAGTVRVQGNNPAYRTDNTTDYTSFVSYLNGNRSWQLDNVSDNFKIYVTGTVNNYIFNIKTTGVINLQNVPTSAVGLVSGDIYRTANVLNIVP